MKTVTKETVVALATEVFLTVAEAAEILRLSDLTIRRFIKAGRIPAFKLGAGPRAGYRIPAEAIRKLANGSK